MNFIGPEVDDPYVLPIPAALCSELLPDVEYPDIYPVLSLTRSGIQKLKYIAAGWVCSVHAYAALADSSKVIATVYV